MSTYLIALVLFILATILFVLHGLGVTDEDLLVWGLAATAAGLAFWVAPGDRRVP
jgi:hypothetical protein